MCILFIAIRQHKDYPLIIAANRDEFHDRATLPSHFWGTQPDILAGRDQLAGGTWMGINEIGNLAAITNIRAPGREVNDTISRGALVSDFLHISSVSQSSLQHYHQQMSAERFRYNGFNLLYGHLTDLYVYNNFEDDIQKLGPGVYGLSNAMLNTPWPKLDFGKATLAAYCQSSTSVDTNKLFTLLQNQQLASDDRLPKTGVPLEWERRLSSIFIRSPDYGTRSSTILLLNNHNQIYWQERCFDPTANERVRNEFKLTLRPN